MGKKKARMGFSVQEYSELKVAKDLAARDKFCESMRLKQVAEDSDRILFSAQMKVFRKEV